MNTGPHTMNVAIRDKTLDPSWIYNPTDTLPTDLQRGPVLKVTAPGPDYIVGKGETLRKLLQQVDLVAPTDANVLILGESGTGKELIARYIHERSRRNGQALVRVNCSAIPKDLFESEFFGHVRGSFTGATGDRTGRFERADKGTLFLDEIGDVPLDLQCKLLRVLQEREIERVGEGKVRKVDVRIVAATNRDLKEEVRANRFREDLYFRLNVVPLKVPSLRERLEDIPELARHFVRLSSQKNGCPHPELTPTNVVQLQSYEWPGNIRELQNIIERAVILSPDRHLRFDSPKQTLSLRSIGLETADKTRATTNESDRKGHERANIIAALEKTQGKVYGQGGAAALLGVKPTTLASRIKALDIKKHGRVSSHHYQNESGILSAVS